MAASPLEIISLGISGHSLLLLLIGNGDGVKRYSITLMHDQVGNLDLIDSFNMLYYTNPIPSIYFTETITTLI